MKTHQCAIVPTVFLSVYFSLLPLILQCIKTYFCRKHIHSQRVCAAHPGGEKNEENDFLKMILFLETDSEPIILNI